MTEHPDITEEELQTMIDKEEAEEKADAEEIEVDDEESVEEIKTPERKKRTRGPNKTKVPAKDEPGDGITEFIASEDTNYLLVAKEVGHPNFIELAAANGVSNQRYEINKGDRVVIPAYYTPPLPL